MSDKSWRLGQICAVDDSVNLEKAVLVAEVFSRALTPEDGGLVATYFLVHDLDPAVAERAMLFFSSQPSLLVNAARLVDDAQAEHPALVTIRYTDETQEYLATAYDWDFLRLLPGEDVISRDGWDIFCAHEALLRGDEVDAADPLPAYDYRELRRKVLLNRAIIEEDRVPWLEGELAAIREVTRGNPEGSETFIARAEDIEAVLNNQVEVGATYAIVIPTKVERGVQKGAIFDWIPQAGREIVVAHGLNAIQAARALKVVADDPDAFVSKSHLLSSKTEREYLCAPLLIPDSGLNWISTDFTGRRDAAGYGRLQDRVNGQSASVTPVLQSVGAER